MDFEIKVMWYNKGGEHQRETVDVGIEWENGEIEQISRAVYWWISGGTLKSYVNDEDIVFDFKQQISVLEFILAERQKLISSLGKKTYSAWHGSGLDFGDYCSPGDVVDREMVDYFADCMPPITLRNGCNQCGEPQSMEEDGHGACRETYITFRKEGEKWIFDGYCFEGENVNRYTKGTLIERTLKRLKAIPQVLHMTFIGEDDLGCYVYKDERGKLWKHTDCNSPREACQARGDRLLSVCGNTLDREPDCLMRKGIEVVYVN